MTQAHEAASTPGHSCQRPPARPPVSPRRGSKEAGRRQGCERPFSELDGSPSHGSTSSALAAGVVPGPQQGVRGSLGPLSPASGSPSQRPSHDLALSSALSPSMANRSLESQGVELLRLGRDSRGRGELILRVRCGDEVLHARLAEDNAGGVRVFLGGTLGEGRMHRLADSLASQGHDAQVDLQGGEPGGRGNRNRRPPLLQDTELEASTESQAFSGAHPGFLRERLAQGRKPTSAQRLDPAQVASSRGGLPRLPPEGLDPRAPGGTPGRGYVS